MSAPYMPHASPAHPVDQHPGAGASEELTIYLDTSPYPHITGGNDPDTVALLKENYAGIVSELTAITQYVYQNIVTADDKAFSSAIQKIAVVEMSHLNMIGNAIQLLGGVPTFGDGRHFWQAGNVNYATNLAEMLRADIDAENKAIASYERHASQTGNSSVRCLLLRIIQDEKLHLRFFTEMLARVPAEER
jgi:bacterioferritin